MLNGNLHGTTKHKKFFPLVFHNLITKILNQIRNVDWSVVLVRSWYLDFVFVFVAEEHFQASTEDVSRGEGIEQKVLRKLHSNIQGIFLIVLHSHFFALLTQAAGDVRLPRISNLSINGNDTSTSILCTIEQRIAKESKVLGDLLGYQQLKLGINSALRPL